MDTAPQDKTTQPVADPDPAHPVDATRRYEPPILASAFTRLHRRPLRRAARAILEGRRIDASQPARGRFLRSDVDALLEEIWRRTDEMLGQEDLRRIPTAGNLLNVCLAATTTAAYHALLAMDIDRDYAMELCADVGWKVYERMLAVPLRVARIATRDPHRQLQLVLHALMRFPFSAPGAPGYAVHSWSDGEMVHTHWRYCAPLGFVKRYVERNGDRGEVEAFYRSWCLYDWAAADVLAGRRTPGRPHYARPHTLSRDDTVCDMCWRPAGSLRPDSERCNGDKTGL